jgi:ribosomal protein L16 Arg81 hydroxylase
MTTPNLDLTRLLHPVEWETFLRENWEKRPLILSRNDPDHYRGLFALHDVDTVLAFSKPKFLEPDDLQPGPPVVHNYAKGSTPEDDVLASTLYPDIAVVRRAFERGRTLILNDMQMRWPPIAALCRLLEDALGSPIHTNLYLTPPGEQGFNPHYDTHEVFVLQIEGTKHWRLYGSGRELPLAPEAAIYEREQLGPPTEEVLLRPGALLYLPRGHIHEAFTTDHLSLHLTMGVRVYRWADLLHQAVDAVSAREARLRASLPPRWLDADPETLHDALRPLLHLVADSDRANEAVSRLATSFLKELTSLPGAQFVPVDLASVSADTILERAPGAICRVSRHEDGRVTLHYPGGSLDGPARIGAALHFIARNPRFAVRSLPDTLTSEGKLILVRRLVQDRFLTIVAASEPFGREPPASAEVQRSPEARG